MATILALACFVRDALQGASPETVARRLATLKACVAAAKDADMLTTLADPAIEDMIAAVESVVAHRTDEMFDATIAAYMAEAASVRGLPAEPPAPALEAIMRAGNLARDRAVALWRELAVAIAPAAGKR
ncbi:MAG TPA: hypothetical protein VD978_08380 [Azospirillum sp.]|nr:hypothetical protein [Azospirillum sp.]